MQTPYLLFRSHLDLAQSYWQRVAHPGDLVIDATSGNGHDTLFLASLVGSKEKSRNLIAIDIQAAALGNTEKRLKEALPVEMHQCMRLLNQCHSTFPSDIAAESVALVIYNLGYLPGGDKSLTTMRSTTMMSLQAALPLIRPGGMLSVTCYPGHPEGKEEEELVLAFAAAQDPKEWSCCHHRWLNRKAAPSLLVMQKAPCAKPNVLS